MFYLMAKRRNLYLHKVVECIDPGIINRSVCRAMDIPVTNPFDSSPPLLINVALQPMSFAVRTDYTQADLAYGDWGIPQLIRQLHDKDPLIRSRALTTLNDELRNPEKCYRAHKNFQIVSRMSEVLLELISSPEINEYSLERTVLNFAIMGTYLQLALEMMKYPSIFQVLYPLISGMDEVSIQSARALATISYHQEVADQMVQTGHLTSVMDIIARGITTISDVFTTLANLSERSPTETVNHGFIQVLLKFLNKGHPCETIIMKSFAIMLQCNVGQEICDRFDVIPALLSTLKNPNSHVQTIEYAVMALHNCLISTRSRWRAREFWDLPLILVTCAHNKQNERLQMHALQALLHIIEMPSIKEFVKKVLKKKIKSICCDTERTHYYKLKVLRELRRQVFRHERPKNDTASDLVVCDPIEHSVIDQSHRFSYRYDVYVKTPSSNRSSVDTKYLMEMVQKDRGSVVGRMGSYSDRAVLSQCSNLS